MEVDVVKRVLAALEARGVRYAIFGAVALNLHGLARSTEALDLFVAPEEANIERLKLAVNDVLDDPEIANVTADDLLGDYPAVQYFPPSGAFQAGGPLPRVGGVGPVPGMHYRCIAKRQPSAGPPGPISSWTPRGGSSW